MNSIQRNICIIILGLKKKIHIEKSEIESFTYGTTLNRSGIISGKMRVSVPRS